MSLTDIMSSMNLSTYPVIAMIIFTTVFIAVMIKVMRLGSSAHEQALLPFADESNSQSKSENN